MIEDESQPKHRTMVENRRKDSLTPGPPRPVVVSVCLCADMYLTKGRRGEAAPPKHIVAWPCSATHGISMPSDRSRSNEGK
jgi:hypothetical protein